MNERAMRGAVLFGVLVYVALRLFAVQQVAFNWDEFAFFHQVTKSAEEGVLHSGGHAGLPQAALIPYFEGCEDEITVARTARRIWLLLCLAALAGLYALLCEILPAGPMRRHDAALGTALLGLAPVFLEWSLQVRTDQVALAGGIWGSAALVASRRRPSLAWWAGLAFGIGWLGTQKLAYFAALGGLLALGDLLLAREWRMRREVLRGIALAAGAGIVVGAWRVVVPWLFQVRESHPALTGTESVSGYLNAFEFYRLTIGTSQYLAEVPNLLPHLLLLAGLVGVSVLGGAARTRRLVLAWSVALLGVAVGAFHAAAFAYFLMTLGVFASVAIALSLDPLRRRLAEIDPSAPRIAFATLWSLLIGLAIVHEAGNLENSQAVQRDSLRFVHRNFPPDRAGFHPEKALFCGVRQPGRIWFSQHIYQAFEGKRRDAEIADLVAHFRSEPVHYLLQSFRLNQFPLTVRRFWDEHYQPYRDAVFVAGSRFEGSGGDFTLLVEGPYRWLPREAEAIRVDGEWLAPGEVRVLSAGAHRAAFERTGVHGVLVLALGDPPGPAPRSFYKSY